VAMLSEKEKTINENRLEIDTYREIAGSWKIKILKRKVARMCLKTKKRGKIISLKKTSQFDDNLVVI
jgi:hypothetical protein